jgi:hypothetical protein
MRTAGTTTETSDLTELDDPAFITHWAGVRGKLALTPKDDPSYAEAKLLYDAALNEYRKRVAVQATR